MPKLIGRTAASPRRGLEPRSFPSLPLPPPRSFGAKRWRLTLILQCWKQRLRLDAWGFLANAGVRGGVHRMSLAAQRIEPDPRFEVLMSAKPPDGAFQHPTWGQRKDAPRCSASARRPWPFGALSCRRPCQPITQAVDPARFLPSLGHDRLVSIGLRPHGPPPLPWRGGSGVGVDLIAGGIVRRSLGDA